MSNSSGVLYVCISATNLFVPPQITAILVSVKLEAKDINPVYMYSQCMCINSQAKLSFKVLNRISLSLVNHIALIKTQMFLT